MPLQVSVDTAAHTMTLEFDGMLGASNNVQHDASILHLLHRASLSADELFAFFVGYKGPSSRQYAILKAVARSRGASQAAIVSSTGIDRSTTSEMVRGLVNKGWLQRRRAKDDARAFAVRLTAVGRKILRGGEGAAWETDEKVLAALSSTRRAVLVKALGKIVETHRFA
jgi:DNA-binding MarR family transcriptional regulator